MELSRLKSRLIIAALSAPLLFAAPGCKQATEQASKAGEYISDGWNEFSGKKGQKKNEDQITLAGLQKSAEEKIAAMSSSARNGAVSIVKDGTKQAYQEVRDTTTDAVSVAARGTKSVTSDMTGTAVSAEKAARQYVYYYMPDNLPRSEKEARDVMFNNSGGIFESIAQWFRNLSQRGGLGRRLIGERAPNSNSQGKSGGKRSLDGRRRPDGK